MVNRRCIVMLAALLAGMGTPASAQDLDLANRCPPLGSVTVDFIMLNRKFTAPDLAYTTTTSIPGVANAGPVYFNEPSRTVPRINAQLFITEDWSISSSYYRLPNFDQVIGFNNTTAATQVTSASFPYGPTSVNSTIVGGGPR